MSETVKQLKKGRKKGMSLAPKKNVVLEAAGEIEQRRSGDTQMSSQSWMTDRYRPGQPELRTTQDRLRAA